MRFSMTIALVALLVLVESGIGQENTNGDSAINAYRNAYLSAFATGKVVDVFEGNRLLLSLGANHKVEAGWKLYVYRLKPEPLNLGRVELLEVGAKHSIGQFRGGSEVRENDLVSLFNQIPEPGQGKPHFWFPFVRPKTSETPRSWEIPPYGGALIDLSPLRRRNSSYHPKAIALPSSPWNSNLSP